MKTDISEVEPSDLRTLPIVRASQDFTERRICRIEAEAVLLINAREPFSTPSSETSPGSSGYIRRTLAIFQVGEGLPAIELTPVTSAEVSNAALVFAARAASALGSPLGFGELKLSAPPTAPEAEDLRGLARNYVVSLGESNWLDSSQGKHLKPGVREGLQRLFHATAVRYLATAPGWFVQFGGEWMAIWRHHRYLGEEETPDFLREAKQVRDLLTNNSVQTILSLSIVATPRRPERFCRIFSTIFGAMAGFVFGLVVQMGIWILVDPSTSPSLWPFIPASVLGIFLSRRYLEPMMLKQEASKREGAIAP